MQRLALLFYCIIAVIDGFGIQPPPFTRISSSSITSPKNADLSIITTSTTRRTTSSLLMAGMAQPETQIKTGVKTETKRKQKQAQKQQTKSGEPVSKRKEEFEDAPMYKLMLLQDDGADVEHVVTRLCAIVDEMDEDQAATVFEQAQLSGKAMCGKYPFERAELFKEQLLRSDPMIFADMEEENA